LRNDKFSAALCRYNAVRFVGILLWQESNAFAREETSDRMLCQLHGWNYAVLYRYISTSRLGVEPRLGHLHGHTGRSEIVIVTRLFIGMVELLVGPFHGAIAVPSVTRCRRCCRGHRCAGGVTSDTWLMGVRRLAVANGPNIFQMLRFTNNFFY